MERLLTIVLLTMLLNCAIAQPQVDYKALKEKYNQSNMIYLQNTEDMKIEMGSNGLEISSDIRTQILMLNEQSTSYSEKKIGYSDHFEEIKNLEAYTFIPEGRKYKKQEVKNIEERKASKDGIFYDDAREKYFIYPGVQPGAITHLEYKQIYKDPHFIGAFWFDNYVPVKHSRYSITVPQQVKIKFKLFGDSSLIKFSVDEKKNKTIYSWEANDLPKKEFESDAGSMSNRPTHVIPYIAGYEKDGKFVNVLSDVNAFYAWYYAFAKNVNQSTSPELKQLVDSLTKNINTREAKIRAIYYWVQDNIKYIAFEDGLGGYIPRDASLVCNRRYGDCKDMSSLLSSMLQTAGVEAYMTLVGTRDIPYQYEDLPTPQMNNHMICAVKHNERWTFLDATFSKIPLGVIPYHIQGKEALIIQGPDKYEIYKIPFADHSQNLMSDSLSIKITGTTTKGKGHIAYSGFGKYNLDIETNGMASKYKYERLQNFAKTGNNKCKIDTLIYSGSENRDSPLIVDFDFTIPDYITQVENSIFINMNFEKPFQSSFINKEEKKFEKEYNYMSTNQSIIYVEIPSGYKLKKLPDNAHWESPLLSFDFKYSAMGNYIKMERTIILTTLEIEPAMFDTWNNTITRLGTNYKLVAEFVKK